MDRGENYCSEVQLVRRWAQSGFRFNGLIELWLVRNRAEPEISLVVTPGHNNQLLVGRSESTTDSIRLILIENNGTDIYRTQSRGESKHDG